MLRILFRRRELPVPTLWGWTALLLLFAGAVVSVGRGLHGFLAVEDPSGAKLLVVEGWIGPHGLDQAVLAFRAGSYERVVTTGGAIRAWPAPPHSTYAHLAADYLKAHGLAHVPVTPVPAPAVTRARTYHSALAVQEWLARSGQIPAALDVFSLGPHARRSRLLYRLALGPEARVGVRAARSEFYDGRAWWGSDEGVRDVLEQAVEWAWVRCCFRPPA